MHSQLLQTTLSWLAGISLITFILSLLCIPFAVGLLSPDCFIQLSSAKRTRPRLTAGFLLLLIIRNLLGILLVVAGVAMLFLPGQGLLTILLGVLLISFPGKHRLIIHLVRPPSVRRSLDWIRVKRNKPAFLWPEED